MKGCEVLLYIVLNIAFFGEVVEGRLIRDTFHRLLMWVRNLFNLALEFLAPIHARDILGPFKVR